MTMLRFVATVAAAAGLAFAAIIALLSTTALEVLP